MDELEKAEAFRERHEAVDSFVEAAKIVRKMVPPKKTMPTFVAVVAGEKLKTATRIMGKGKYSPNDIASLVQDCLVEISGAIDGAWEMIAICSDVVAKNYDHPPTAEDLKPGELSQKFANGDPEAHEALLVSFLDPLDEVHLLVAYRHTAEGIEWDNPLVSTASLDRRIAEHFTWRNLAGSH